jgi:hypothetical protein
MYSSPDLLKLDSGFFKYPPYGSDLLVSTEPKAEIIFENISPFSEYDSYIPHIAGENDRNTAF